MERLATSKYNLNADFGLGYFDMIKWMIYNYLNNKNGDELKDQRVIMKRFTVPNLDNWDKVDSLASPARRLCDFYWMDMDWSKVSSNLGSNIRAVEIGCGTGVYGKLLETILEDNLEFYRGIDINENEAWDDYKDNHRFQFLKGNASTIEEDLQGTNFIFTQSALEHFEKDLSFFKQVSTYVENASHPVIQVHLVPSRSCITTFPWHGFRQYTNSSISMVTELFSDKSEFEWIALGGEACNRVHRKFITKPIYTKRGDLRVKLNDQYNKELQAAILSDNNSPKLNEATFSALVIRSNIKG